MARHARPLLSPLTQPSPPGPRLFHACRPKLFNISSKVAALTPDHEQLEDPEAFYNFWLSFKLRPAQPVRTYCSHHLQNLDLATWLERLPPGLKEDPLAFFGSASKGRDLDLARVCLNAYIAKRNQLLPDKETVREHYIRDRPGSKALLWLWYGTSRVRI
ncbi:hypothetical protein Tdes44962_MAKER04811 [Teratosphaeria destructans]|uniref:Uncharacterized protein n=1 Tax=Teratosphaeria destructans TaxID=418781 RepID=A0A9W7SLF7_9PEZI|nr:hypothetical protein Tdes44962_MAKER04811 [Teratosphaeria destructans]